MRASMHLQGSNCPQCAKELGAKKLRKTTESFIKESKSIHGDKFGYEKTKYLGKNCDIVITCPIHGDVMTTPEVHLRGLGCPECSHKAAGDKKRFTKEEFVRLAREVHGNKYDYRESNYISMKTPITIKCLIHGCFSQTPHDHIKNQTGCPKCRSSKLEKELRNYLLSNNILFSEQYTWDWLVYEKTQHVDFYLPKFNVIVECQGAQHFEIIDCFGGKDKLNLERLRDQNKKRLCEEHGITVLYFSNLSTEREKYQYPYTVYEDLEELLQVIKQIGLTNQSEDKQN